MKVDKDRLANILHHNQTLSHLEFRYGQENQAPSLEMELLDLMSVISSNTSSKLDSLSVDYQRLSLTASFSQSRSQSMTMTIKRLDRLDADDLSYIQQGHLTQLILGWTPMKGDKGRLANILHHNQTLSHLELIYRERNGPFTGNAPVMRLPDLVSVVISAPCALESFRIDYEELKMSARVLHGKTQDVFVMIEQLGGLHSDDLSFIEQGCLSRLEVGDTPRETDRDRLGQILQKNPGLVRFQIGHIGEHSNVINSDPHMKLRDLVMLATSNAFLKLESLEISDGNLSFTPDIAQRKISDVGTTINRIETFSPEDFKFIQEYTLTKLAIKRTPQEADENQLTDMLHQLPTLSQLQVGCRGERSFAIVNLIVTTRDNIIQERGSCSLRTFELMSESMVPFDILAYEDSDTRIHSHLSFHDGSKEFDMRTWIRLSQVFKDNEPVKDFVCLYGWSIVFFDGAHFRKNTFTYLWNHIPRTRTAQIERINVDTTDLAGFRVDHLPEIIRRSPNFKTLGLTTALHHEDELQKVVSLKNQYGTILTKLSLTGDSPEQFSKIALFIPTRSSLPSLEMLELWPDSGTNFTRSHAQWIIAMVSSPPRELSSPSVSQPLLQTIVDEQSPNREPEPAQSWTPLRKILLQDFILQPEDWREVMEAIDFSALEYLDFWDSNIPEEQFRILVDRMTEDTESNLSLRILAIRPLDLAKMNYSQALSGLRKRAPALKIIEN